MEEFIAHSYSEAEAFLAEVPKFTKKNPLEATKGFYAYLQSSGQGRYREEGLGRVIHVAGTNGKGSVCAFLQQICIESGYRTGLFLSPHLVTTRERFCIDGRMIPEAAFAEAFNWLAASIEGYRRIEPGYAPTYFERLFFMGLYIFTNAGTEVTILETGLGGRLDTTNVLRRPTLTVITMIGFDHMAYLGDTIGKIAAEKAGIIKPGVPVIFSDRKKEASKVIREKAAEYGCACHAVSRNDYKINEFQKKCIDFSVVSRYYDYGSFTVSTLAPYQVENAAVAVRAAETLKKDCGLDQIVPETIQEGIRRMAWPGRMEEIAPRVFLDGAHNEDGIMAFVQAVRQTWPLFGAEGRSRCVLIFSAVKDKQYEKMIEMLCGLSMVTDFVATQLSDARGAALAELGDIFGRYADSRTQRIHIYERMEDALSFGISARGDRGVLYIAGSLYLAGLVKAYMEEHYDKF